MLGPTRQRFMELQRQDKPPAVIAVHSKAELLTNWTLQNTWSGRTANTDRAVFCALIRRMMQEGKEPFRASIREVADIAGFNKDTVHISINRLKERSFIRLEGIEKPTSAALYSFPLPIPHVQSPYTMPTYSPPLGGSVRNLHTSHDAFSMGALGKNALFLWENIKRKPGTVSELTATWHVHRTTVVRALKKLHGAGLAYKEGDSWHGIEAGKEVLDGIAILAGTAGKRQRRKEKYQQERERRVVYLVRKCRKRLGLD